jgi:hypothetical protein
VVEVRAQLPHGLAGDEVRLDGLRALLEERHGLVAPHRGHRELVLGCDGQRLAAGDQDLELGACADERGDIACGVDEMLEVVEDEQHESTREERCRSPDRIALARQPRAVRSRDLPSEESTAAPRGTQTTPSSPAPAGSSAAATVTGKRPVTDLEQPLRLAQVFQAVKPEVP